MSPARLFRARTGRKFTVVCVPRGSILSLLVGSFVIQHIGIQTEHVPWSFPHLAEAIAICSMGVPCLVVLAARLLLPDEYLTESVAPVLLENDLSEAWDTQNEEEGGSSMDELEPLQPPQDPLAYAETSA